MRPKTLILRTAGVNCDKETAHAFALAGAGVELVHINRLLERPALLDEYQLLAVPGGFSYGDDVAAGKIMANQMVHHLSEPLARFVEMGKPVIGICNGFQVLVKTGLLPGPWAGQAAQTCTLALNECGRFVDRWVHLAPRSSKCIWTDGLDPLDLPIAHGEGRFVAADDRVRRVLWEQDQVALVYATAGAEPAGGRFPDNPNGSEDDIAGICDASGVVLGLMPHPERYVDPLQHPAWTRQDPRPAVGAGLAMFERAVKHAVSAVGSVV